MTLCEIATGNHYSIPLECHGFHPGGPDALLGSHPLPRASAASQCVEWVQMPSCRYNSGFILTVTEIFLSMDIVVHWPGAHSFGPAILDTSVKCVSVSSGLI
jgi:hypothetical protein